MESAENGRRRKMSGVLPHVSRQVSLLAPPDSLSSCINSSPGIFPARRSLNAVLSSAVS